MSKDMSPHIQSWKTHTNICLLFLGDLFAGPFAWNWSGVSIVVAVADFFPSEGSWDEVVLLVSEALIDSYSFGRELLDPYVKRLEYETGRYFLKRYHGYITGTGLVFGLLARIPLLSSACLIAGEVGRAQDVCCFFLFFFVSFFVPSVNLSLP